MSYKHLTGRLIETQRSMIGEPAIRIARSVDGITVSDEGAVKAVDGDGMAVVADLADRYTDVLGGAAERRLQAAADEFADELRLPPELGGPEGAAGIATSGLASDGGTVAAEGYQETGAPARDRAPRIDGEADASSDVTSEPGETADPESPDSSDAAPAESEPVVCEYTLATTLPAAGDPDLASVYLMPAGEDAWESPVSVETAVVDELTAATGLSDDGVDAVVASIDADRLFATLAGENGETVSFGSGTVTLTFHRSGAMAIH